MGCVPYEFKIWIIRLIFFSKTVLYPKAWMHPLQRIKWRIKWTYNSQKTFSNPENENIIKAAFRQITGNESLSESQLVIISSSTGSVVAAQTACYLAQKNLDKQYLTKPFHLVLGASMISSKSELHKTLLYYQQQGQIGVIMR